MTTLNERFRGGLFRKSYWERCVEMTDLLDESDHAKMLAAAEKANVSRSMRKDLRRSAPTQGTPMTLDEVDAVAKNYAMWRVRQKFDWNQREFAARASPMARQIHVGLVAGILDLDIKLRRQVEQLLRQEHPEPARVAQLRLEIESTAGTMAADVDLCHTVDAGPMRYDWDLICEEFDAICNHLDQLLTRAAGEQEGWLSDPTGRYELRYWDGSEWTVNVSTGSAQSIDPLDGR